MPIFQVEWRESRGCTVFIVAENETAAGQSWIEGRHTEPFYWEVETSQSPTYTELPGPHDKLCCCPICEGG